MVTTLITLTYNRHKLLERVVRCFLDQDYEHKHYLVIFNTGYPTELAIPPLPDNKGIILINNTSSYITGNEYSCVGEKYCDALKHLPLDTELIMHQDDDDLFLPNHITESVKGYKRAKELNKTAYKAYYSYFKYQGAISLEHNTFEGSIIMEKEHVLNTQYLPVSVKYHDAWLLPLVENNKILCDKNGVSTFVYDWGGEIPAYKMSGREDTQENFLDSQQRSFDYGDGIVTPVEKIDYNQITSLGTFNIH